MFGSLVSQTNVVFAQMPVEVGESDFAQVGSPGPIEHLTTPESPVQCWPEIAVTDRPPACDLELIGIHVLPGDVSLEARRLRIGRFLDFAYNVAKRHSPPSIAGVHRATSSRRSAIAFCIASRVSRLPASHCAIAPSSEIASLAPAPPDPFDET